MAVNLAFQLAQIWNHLGAIPLTMSGGGTTKTKCGCHHPTVSRGALLMIQIAKEEGNGGPAFSSLCFLVVCEAIGCFLLPLPCLTTEMNTSDCWNKQVLGQPVAQQIRRLTAKDDDLPSMLGSFRGKRGMALASCPLRSLPPPPTHNAISNQNKPFCP